MAITISTTPQNIDNSAAFSVVTSLVEDSTHVNLRVRADIYHEGIIKATVEKPKGIQDFDFSDILKSLTPGLKFTRDSGDYIKTGTSGSNLLTGWFTSVGSWDTLTVSGAQITSAIEASSSAAFVKSNDLTVVAGELYLIYLSALTSSGARIPYFIETGDNEGTYAELNKGVLFMPKTSGTFVIELGHDSGQMNFSCTGVIYKITTNRTTIGNPLAPYVVKFTEVYEDNAGATQTGATWRSKVRRYVPSSLASFTEYVLHDNASLFSNKTLRNNITKFYTTVPHEYHLQFFTEYVQIDMAYSKNGGGASTLGLALCFEGWGVVILNVGELLATVTSTLALKILQYGSTDLSETITINADSSCNPERTILEFTGETGGKEYLAFDGLADIEYVTERNYRTGVNRNRKPLSFRGMLRQKLETVFKDIANTSYLKSLMTSEDVKRLEPSYAAPTEVTIVSDSVSITKGRELFVNQIEIEYEE